jgi:PAS domain S-box-containing protein
MNPPPPSSTATEPPPPHELRASPSTVGAVDDQVEVLLSHLPDVAVLVIDHDLRFIGVGGPGLSQVGWEPDELLGRTLDEVVPPDEAATLGPHYRAALAGQTVSFEHRGVRALDHVHQVDIAPIQAPGGGVEAIMVIARDVTDHRRQAHELAASQQQIRALIEASPDMLAVYDLEGRYVSVSPAAEQLFGWRPEELVGTSSYDYFHPDDIALIRSTHDEVLDAPDTGVATYRLRCKDGSYRWVEVIGRQLLDAQTGQAHAIQCTTRDISRRHEMEEALRELNEELARSNAELERFAAVASHDLRSPLATALGLLDLLARQLPDATDPLITDVLDRSRRQLWRLTDTVDGLLELARIGTTALEPQQLTAAELVAEVLETIGPELAAADVTVALHADTSLVGDRRQLRIAVQNLLSNATRATSDARRVHVGVRARRTEQGWALEVEDDGDGIPEELRARLFEPAGSARPDGDGRRGGAGLGFGLATCRRIAQRHGGSLEVEHLPHGTRFVLQGQDVTAEDTH